MSSDQMFFCIMMILSGILVAYLFIKSSEKRSGSYEQLSECNEALNLLVFNTSGKNWGAVLFHKLHAVNFILEHNLLHFNEAHLNAYSKDFKEIRDGIEMAVARSLAHYNPEIVDLPVFGHEKEIKLLNDLYTELIVFAIQSQNDLLQVVGS
ncbi:MAG: hypothetical protein KBT48_12270 [Firmicutes bacterium]|nr:hypothetical protein [Bacillota bacterium]